MVQQVDDRSADDAALNGTHLRIAVLAAMGAFLDGYDVFIIGGALLLITPQMHLSSSRVGLLGSASFLGACGGAWLFGHLGDRRGRRTIFLWDLVLFAVLCVLEGVVTSFGELLVLRIVLGVAVGADLPISAALIAEIAPTKIRGRLTSLMLVFLFLGGFLASVVAIILFHTAGHAAWRWMFVSGVIPAVVVLALRRSVPESPRWVEARHPAGGQPPAQTRVREIFSGRFLRLSLVIATMWFLLNAVSSSFSIYTPTLLSGLGDTSKLKSLQYSAGSYAITVVVTVATLLLIDRAGRRAVMYGLMSFSLAGAVLLVAAHAAGSSSTAVIFIGVAVSSSTLGASGAVVINLGAEVFPTRMRTTGEGFVVGANKLGAYVGTLIVPDILSGAGVSGMMLVVAGVSVAAIVLTVALGIEPANTALDGPAGESPGRRAAPLATAGS